MTVLYLDLDDVLHIAERVLGGEVAIRDRGLLASAVARPMASAFGDDAYATLHEKCAALLHSIARNHALVDGNKRLALGTTIAFLGVNGRRPTMTNDEAYEFIVAIASGDLDDVPAIAARLRTGTHPTG